MPVWNPTTYLQFSDERSRPFFDLTARVGAENPQTVVDLGCGPGQLTATLSERWPQAQITGIDSSPEMIESAQALSGDRLEFKVTDLRQWRAPSGVDVIVSNAVLQWVPGHRALLPQLVDQLTPHGWLAFQVPINQGAPSHRLLYELAADARFARWTEGLERIDAGGAQDYLADLLDLGCRVEAWETTYLHLLTGEDPVFRWTSGTGARPILQALPEAEREIFTAEYKALLREAYPPGPQGTVLPFRRIFVVAQKAGA